jgi:hypothetical protein
VLRYLNSFPRGNFASSAVARLAYLETLRQNKSPDFLKKTLQFALKNAGCYTGRINGHWGKGAKQQKKNFSNFSEEARDFVWNNNRVKCSKAKK